jgi:hypothetical protein
MAQNRSFLEGGDPEFDKGLDNLVEYVVEKTSGTPPVWTHIPQPAADGLVSARAAWHAACQRTFGAHTPVETEAKNDARKATAAVVRPFIAQSLMFPPVPKELALQFPK